MVIISGNEVFILNVGDVFEKVWKVMGVVISFVMKVICYVWLLDGLKILFERILLILVICFVVSISNIVVKLIKVFLIVVDMGVKFFILVVFF